MDKKYLYDKLRNILFDSYTYDHIRPQSEFKIFKTIVSLIGYYGQSKLNEVEMKNYCALQKTIPNLEIMQALLNAVENCNTYKVEWRPDLMKNEELTSLNMSPTFNFESNFDTVISKIDDIRVSINNNYPNVALLIEFIKANAIKVGDLVFNNDK